SVELLKAGLQSIHSLVNESLIGTNLENILVEYVELSVDVVNPFLDLNDLHQSALPDWLGIQCFGFEGLYANVQTIQARIYAIEAHVYQIELRIDPDFQRINSRVHRI